MSFLTTVICVMKDIMSHKVLEEFALRSILLFLTASGQLINHNANNVWKDMQLVLKVYAALITLKLVAMLKDVCTASKMMNA